jgi:hypothetical protein
VLGGASVGCADAKPPFGKIEQFTGRLELPDGSVCSGTRDGTAIITSRHCMEGPSRQVRFQGILCNVLRVWIHGENIFVYTDRNWGQGPRFGTARKGDELYIIGNAGGFEQIARTATLAGRTVYALPGHVNAVLIACASCWHGDSGAGVFNAKGELVAVFLGSFNTHVIEASGEPSLFSLAIAVPIQ